MAIVLGSDLTGTELAEKIAAMAAGKQHKLAPYQVDGRHPVSPAAADGIMKYLARCEDKEGAVAQPTGAERYFEQREAASPEYREALGTARTRLSFQDVPAGFYATPAATGNNDYDFWKVLVSEKSGFRSVKRVIGGGGTTLPVLVLIGRPQQTSALRAIITTGIAESAALYAELETRCNDCGRQLTVEDSRKYGKGPVCREKNG